MFTLLILFSIFVVAPLVISYKVSKEKNRNYKLWVLLTFFFGWIATVIVLVLEKRARKPKF